MRKAILAATRARPWLFAAFLLLGPGLTPAQGRETEDGDTGSLFEVPLEKLINVQVISPSRVKQQMFDSPNAIWVVTRGDIARSGVRSIPEALRLAPGVYVAQLSGNRWTVTIGGFARGEFSNTLLVLIDGVTVYSTIYGYVDWDLLPVTLGEVERIEVIRGPGGALYGANAVNGVINIITTRAGSGARSYARSEAGTQGVIATCAGGATSSADGKLQGSYAVSYDEDNGLGMRRGEDIHDYQRRYTIALKTRMLLTESTELTVDGRYLSGGYGNPAQGTGIAEATRRPEVSIVRARVDRYFQGGSQFYLQGFYRRQLIFDQNGDVYDTHADERMQDLEFQYTVPFELAGEHRLSWGGGYRWVQVRQRILKDDNYYYTVANAFVHDEWRFLPAWRLNLGAKYEQVSLIDPTWQGRAALLYYLTPRQVFRVSAANSYRSPTLLEYYQDIVVGLPPPLGFLTPLWPPGEREEIFRLAGNNHLEPEKSWSYEAEYRGLWLNRVYLDLSYAYRTYDNLIAQYESDPGFFIDLPPPMGPFGVEYNFKNGGSARSQTVEAGLDARITRALRAELDYGFVDIAVDSGYDDLTGFEYNQSMHFGHFGVIYSDSAGFMADAHAYFLGAIPEHDAQEGRGDYWRLDLRLAKTFHGRDGDLEIGAVGQNLGQEWHAEGTTGSYARIRRAYYGYLEYRIK
jgi:iron complex outermembrane receptor protein